MTNDEWRMTKEIRMIKGESFDAEPGLKFELSAFFSHSSFVIRH